MGEVGFSGGTDKPAKKKGNNGGGRKKATAPPLRVRQYKLNRAEGLNKRQAALKAKFSEAMANNAKKRIEDPYSDYFAGVMEEEIPNQLIARTNREAMGATRLVTASYEGQITDIVEVADWPTRIAATRLATELRGLMPSKPQISVKNNITVPIILKHSVGRPVRPVIEGHNE